MNNITKITLSLLLASYMLQAKEDNRNSIGINLGYKYMPTSQDDKKGTITLANEPDESYLHGEAYIMLGGVLADASLKPSINYMISNNSEFTENLLMVGVNKFYEYKGYDLYAGLLLGVGQQEWTYNPINSTKDTDYTTTSIVGAVQGSIEYPLTKKLSLALNSKVYVHNYSTQLEPRATEEAEINHNVSMSVAVGLRYSFGTTTPKEKIVEKVVEKVVEKIVEKVVVKEVIKEVPVKPIQTPKLYIQFNSNSAKINDIFQDDIKRLENFLVEHPTYKLEIIGHTDTSGNAQKNLKLSQERAYSIYNALVELGVDKKRLSYKGLGGTHPIATNETKKGRIENRRVDVVFSE